MTTAAVQASVDRREAFVAEYERGRAERGGEPEALAALRRAGIERFDAVGFPTLQMEEWRFTNVGPIARTDFQAPVEFGAPELGSLAMYDYDGCARVVLVNGRLAPELSNLAGLPEGVVVSGMAEALERHPDEVMAHLGRHARYEEQPFAALNTALWQDGVFIHVPDKVVVETPINLILLGRPEAAPVAFYPRILIVAGEGSQATVVEQYGSLGAGAYLTCPVTEVAVAEGGVVDHYKLQRESAEAFHMAGFDIHQERASAFSSHSISWGGGIVRNDVGGVLDGEGADLILNGLYLVEGKQVVDHHMRVKHAKAHCTSHELYKGILEGRSRAVFSGRIFVAEGAQKTDAKQTNRNLLLSSDALCNSHPQLEIFADDVRCTHGSTVGQLDETAIFYLRSRGIGPMAARSLLIYAFAADIVHRIKVGAVRRDLEEFMFRRLPRGEVVRQAV